MDRVRSGVFTVLLAVSALASAGVAFGPASPFYDSGRFDVVRAVAAVWVIIHGGLYLLARRRPLAAHVSYFYFAFAVLAMGYQSTTVDWFTRLNMLMSGTYCALFGAMILLPFSWFLGYTSFVNATMLGWIVLKYERFLPPHGAHAAPSVFVSVAGMWALSVAGAGLMTLFYRRMNSARDSLARLNARLKDEVAAQADVIRRHQERLYETQKMEAIGQLAGGVAHDFNNKLTVIAGYSALLADHVKTDAAASHWVDGIRTSTEEAARLTRHLLSFGRREPIQPKVINVNALITARLDVFARLLGEHIELKPALDGRIGNCIIDPAQLEQMLVNLLVNARDAMPTGGMVELTTSCALVARDDPAYPADLDPGSYVTICVRDTGCGMDVATKARVFEPFFTTKEPGKGTGLGLPSAWGAARQNRGSIDVVSMQGAGALFRILLPQVTAPETPVKPVPESISPSMADSTVLVVEDESALRRMITGVLEDHGYRVLSAGDPAEALSVSRAHAGPIHLLITDVTMPGGGGRRVMEEIASLRPETRTIFMSGYAEDMVVYQGVSPGRTFIQKPFTPDILLSRMQEILDGAR